MSKERKLRTKSQKTGVNLAFALVGDQLSYRSQVSDLLHVKCYSLPTGDWPMEFAHQIVGSALLKCFYTCQ